MKQKTELSPHGILIEQVKKATKKFDSELSSDLPYKFMDLIEADQKKRELLKLKIELITGIKDLMYQYQRLFYDYCAANNVENKDEAFDNISNNTESAYNKASILIKGIQKNL